MCWASVFEHLTRDQLTWDELMVKSIDRTGHVFGRWTALSRISGQRKWLCKCECGTVRAVSTSHLRRGKSRSCGCLERELTSARAATHGMTGSPEHRTWMSMRDRCRNPNAAHFECYGGRGITVCDRWANSFKNFFEDMGPKPSPAHSIDRIDVNGNYAPENCRWATVKQQRRNTRANTIVSYLGRNVCIAEAAELSGISKHVLSMRIRRGWEDDRLFSPVRKLNRCSTSFKIAT
jgi:hypothetical protein